MKKLYIIGGGGFGKEVFGWKNDFKESFSNIEILDDNLSKLSSIESIKNQKDLFNFIIAIGNNKVREKIYENVKSFNAANDLNFFIGQSYLGTNIKLGLNNLIMHNSSIGQNSTIGDNNHIHGQTVIGHDVAIGKNNSIGSHVFIGGEVKIGNSVTIYPGSTIAPRIKIEDGATIGIGSVVIRNVKANKTVFGNPAKTIKS